MIDEYGANLLAALTLSERAEKAQSVLGEVMKLLSQSRPHYHWVGIYGLVGDMLHLGPYCGPPTDHVRIPVGRGVCGTAVKEAKNQVIADVSQLDNYLVCNLGTHSEIVVLIWDEPREQILGQIDVDGSVRNAFGGTEEKFLEDVAILIREPVAAWLAWEKQF
jgi:GAF domain-containing protein